MSYSQLMVFRDGVAERDQEFKNSYGTAVMVWETLLRKYERAIFPKLGFGQQPPSGINGGWEALWKADEEGRLRLRKWERIVLYWTYDNALFRGSDVPSLADALDRFEDAHGNGLVVCHLSAVAKRLRELGEVDAVGMYITSTTDNPWFHYDSNDEPAPYKLTDDKHHFIDCSDQVSTPEKTGSAP